MGEYAMLDDEQVKIGTCESMYYLRADQRDRVRPIRGSVNPASEDRFEIRFRFPWPDEDHVPPGSFDPYERTLHIPGVMCPTDVEHYSVQFRADREGYLVSLPCPEGVAECTPGLDTRVGALKIHRNGFRGAVHLAYQKMLRDGRTVPVMQCGGCGSMWRVEDQHDIEAIVVACRSQADRRMGGVNDAPDAHRQGWWHTIADRIAAGAGLSAE